MKHEYFLSKINLDTAVNELRQVCRMNKGSFSPSFGIVSTLGDGEDGAAGCGHPEGRGRRGYLGEGDCPVGRGHLCLRGRQEGGHGGHGLCFRVDE